MRAVTTQLGEKAESIFADLGYEISRDGAEFRAERKWRVVRVSAVETLDSPPERGEYRCFVTWAETADEIRSLLASEDPDYEWAVVAVNDEDDYEVVHAPAV